MIRWRNWRVRGSVGSEKSALGRTLLDDRPGVEEADPVGDLAREAHLVRRDDHRHAAGRQLADDVEDLGDELRVERARDLVEQQDVGLHRQRPDDRHSLLLTARQPVRVLVALVGQAEPRPAARSPRPPPSARGVFRTLRGASVTLSRTDMCGNRLNAWNTIPIRRRIRSTSTPSAVISSPLDEDPAGIDRLEQVDAAQERGLAAPRRADEADDLVLGDVEVDAAQDLQLAEGLVEPLDRERRRRVRRRSPGTRRAARPVARDQPVREPRERDGHDDEHERHRDVRREVEVRRRLDLRRAGRSRPRRCIDTRTVSFCRPMKSLSSGGITRRTACGTITWRSVWKRDRPSERAAASWLGMDGVDAGAVDLGHVRRVDQGQGDDRPRGTPRRGALDPEAGDAEAEDVDDEDPRDRPEDVHVDRRQEPDREEDRARQAAHDREEQAEAEDEHLGDEEQLDVDDEELEDRAIPDELAA